MLLSVAIAFAGCGKKAVTTSSGTPAAKSPSATATTTAPAAPAAPGSPAATAKVDDTKPSLFGMKTGFSADSVIKMSAGNTINMKFTVDGENKSRMENPDSIIIVRKDKSKMWMLNKASKTAMEMPIDKKMLQNMPDIKEQEAKMKYIGRDNVGGYACNKYSVAGQNAGETSTIWVAKKIGLPVKIEAKTPQGAMTIEYKNIKVGKQPASLFELDPGYKVAQMPNMSNMPKGTNMPKGAQIPAPPR
jgi:outer membrane lipoprotein-sorting protein